MRHIIHLNIVHFYAAIEQMLNPRLRSYPIAVASAGTSRRTILDISQQAHDAGLSKGMMLESAKRRCPDLIICNPSFEAYRRFDKTIIDQMEKLSPLVELAGPGHVFIDITGTERLWGRTIDTADRIHKQLIQNFSLHASIGIASNKLVSKIATRIVKPTGLCTIVNGCEESFMAPLPITILPGLEESLLMQLDEFNIHYIKQIHQIPVNDLAAAVGPAAFILARMSKGIDDLPVLRISQSEPSVEMKCVLKEQTNDCQSILRELFMLVSTLAVQLRFRGLGAQQCSLEITYSDGIRAHGSLKTNTPLNGDVSLYKNCSQIFVKIYKRRVRLCRMHLKLSQLTAPYRQMDLFIDHEKEEHLMKAMDQLKAKFGQNVITFGGTPSSIQRSSTTE